MAIKAKKKTNKQLIDEFQYQLNTTSPDGFPHIPKDVSREILISQGVIKERCFCKPRSEFNANQAPPVKGKHCGIKIPNRTGIKNIRCFG